MLMTARSNNRHSRSILSSTYSLISKIIIPLLLFCACRKDDDTPNENPFSGAGSLYYVGCNDAYSFNLSTGTFNWKINPGVGDETGTPFYDSGYLYLADPYGAYALNAVDGARKWRLDYSPLTGFYSGTFKGHVSPVVADSILYTIGFQGVNFKIDLYAIHKHKGTILWQKLLYESTDSLSQPKIIGNKLIIVKINEVVCYDRIAGQLLWQSSCASLGITPTYYPQVDQDFIYIHDRSQNRIVAVNATKGTISKSITLPPDFDAHAFMLKGQYFFGISRQDYSSTSGNTYVINKSTGNSITSTMKPQQNPYLFPFTDWGMSREFLFDIAADESRIYLYSPISAVAFDQATSLKKWENNLPIRKIIDSTGANGIISSNQPIATDNSLIFLSGYRDLSNSTVKDYFNVEVLDKYTGKVIKSLPFFNLECTGIPFYYMVVKDGRGYYPRIDMH